MEFVVVEPVLVESVVVVSVDFESVVVLSVGESGVVLLVSIVVLESLVWWLSVAVCVSSASS